MQFALIGCGLWGEKILRDLLLEGHQVVIVEMDDQRAEVALKLGASRVVGSLIELDEAAGVIVATPASTHASVIAELDANGNQAPIFCEKPLCDTVEAAKQLLQRSGPPVYVMHIWRYHAGIRKLKELLESGVIGRLNQISSLRANWTSPRRDVDTITNLAPHDLSIFQYLLGQLPDPVFARAERIDGQIVGCLAVFEKAGMARCAFEVSNRYATKRREVRLHGSEGVLVLPDDNNSKIQLIKGGGMIVADAVEEISFDSESALMNELQAFTSYINNGNDSDLCSLNEGAEVVCVLNQVRELCGLDPHN